MGRARSESGQPATLKRAYDWSPADKVRCLEGGVMAKFLVRANYTASGTKGLMKEGGSGRKAAVQKVVESLGGKVEAFYFAYGDTDAYVICDFPDAGSGLALSMAVNSSGAASCATVPLITPEEVDAACKKTVSYRAPGA
jgi:uncharacterized protein with GYD domain